MLVDESTSLLVESPTYSGALAGLQPIAGKLVEVETDAEGLVPSSLGAILDEWVEAEDGPKPRVCLLHRFTLFAYQA